MMENLFKNKSILLVTPHSSHRAGMRKTLSDMGADNHLIKIATNLEQARERLTRAPVNMIISDDEIEGKKIGMDLIALHKENNPLLKNRSFVLMVGEYHPFLEAEFSLKGGDLLISKPFTNDTFIKSITHLFKEKNSTSTDQAVVSDVERALNGKDIDQAIELLKSFKDSTSFSALYAQGKVNEANHQLLDAYASLVKASDKKTDFKTLVSLVKIGVACQKHFELLGFVSTWLKKYPIHQYSLTDIIRVILANQKYELLDEIFEMYQSFNIQEESVNTPLAAGYVVASQHYLETKQDSEALKNALKGIHLTNRKANILMRAMEVLIKLGAQDDAEVAYMKFHADLSSDEDYINNLLMKEMIYPKEQILEEALRLLSEKMSSPELYRIAIRSSETLGKDSSELLQKARKAFPTFSP